MKHKKKILTVTVFSMIVLPLFVILNPPQRLQTKGITKIEWTNNRGGSGVCFTKYDSGDTWKWDCNDIPLQSGQNILTVIATNTEGKKGSDILVVNRQ